MAIRLIRFDSFQVPIVPQEWRAEPRKLAPHEDSRRRGPPRGALRLDQQRAAEGARPDRAGAARRRRADGRARTARTALAQPARVRNHLLACAAYPAAGTRARRAIA